MNISRLMSNLILQFLSAPRADTRRYEILRLMASILQWNDAEREKAGLQRHSDRSSGYNILGLGGLLSFHPRQPSQSEEKSPGDEVRIHLAHTVRYQPLCRVPIVRGREGQGEHRCHQRGKLCGGTVVRRGLSGPDYVRSPQPIGSRPLIALHV